MVGLEKNRVFDTTKLETLRSVGRTLISTGNTACTEWDIAVASLKSLEELLPADIKSVELATALSEVEVPLSKPEYGTTQLSLDHTLGKLTTNMPLCDSDAAAALNVFTIATSASVAMIEDLQRYITLGMINHAVEGYSQILGAYDSKWNQTEISLDEAMEEAQTVLKGLPDYCEFYGDPVNMETGNFTYRYVDLETGGIEPFTFTRFYNAMDINRGTLGRGWIHSWETRLLLEEERIILIHEDGREEYFPLEGSGRLRKMDDHYFYQDAHEQIYAFDESGKLIRLQKADGKYAELIYEDDKPVKVQAGTGESFSLFYDEDGKLIRLTDGTGRSVTYSYEKKKLVQVTDPLGKTLTYEYAPNGKIRQMIDKRGIPVLINSYDDRKRILSQEFPDGGVMKFEYLSRNRVCVTEQNGNQIIYTHDNQHRSIETAYADGKEVRCYDESGRCCTYIDKRGNRTAYEYDRFGAVTCITDALAGKTVAEYDGDGRLLRLVKPDGGENTYLYDGSGRLIKSTDSEGNAVGFTYYQEERKPDTISLPDGSRISITYDQRGNISAINYPDGTGAVYAYDELNRVVESCDSNGNSTRFVYDAMNRIIQVTRADGLTRTYRYNEMGQALEIKDFDGYSAYWEYNALNKPATYTDKCGRSTQMEYDLMWNLTRVTDPEGGVTEYLYNTLNRLEAVKEIGGSSIRFTYDANGNRTQIEYPDGTSVHYAYDELNRRVAVTDENGNITRIIYDCVGNVSRIVDAAGNETAYEYDRNGNRVKQTDATGAVTHYTYTALGKPETITDPAGRVTRYHYGMGGRLIKLEKGDGTWEAYEYDRAGNITTRSHQDGRRLVYRYDCLNRVTEIRNGEIREKAYEYDAMGRVTAAIDACGNRMEYCYSPEGKLVRVTDPEGGQVRYTYNGRDELTDLLCLSAEEATCPDEDYADISRLNGENHSFHRMLFERNPAGRTEKVTEESGESIFYRYDVMGRVISRTDEEGREAVYQYYPGGRIREAAYSDGKSVAYSYDALNRLAVIRDWLGETVFEYDAAGRVTKTTDHRGESMEYGWNADGTRKWMQYPDGREVDYRYDDYGRLAALTSDRFRLDYAYDERGYLAEVMRGNGIRSRYSYDRLGHLTRLVHQGEEAILETFTYSYDDLGNRTGIRRESSEEGYSYDRSYRYDRLNRLKGVYEDGSPVREYGYDACGNRLSGNGISIEPLFGSRGELEALSGNGQLLQENFYNGLGCRVGMKKGQLSAAEYHIDYTDGFRHVIMESGERMRHYLWQGNELLGVAGEENYVLSDALHTPVRVTDRQGRSGSCYAFDEFGIPVREREEIPLPFGFTGYLRDEIPGLYHAGAREYDSRSGRFLTRDQLRYMDFEEPISLNLYLYARGNPLRYTDPSGHECIAEESYLNRTVSHVVLGGYTDDITLLGLGVDVLLGVFDLDIMMDIRDLSSDFTVNYHPTELSWWGMVAIDAVGFLPLLGAAKYLDEAGALAKNTVKTVRRSWDDILTGVRHADTASEVFETVFSLGRKNRDEAIKSVREIAESSSKRINKLDELEEAFEGGTGHRYSVDSTMFPDDEAAGVLRNGEYVKNPTAHNINDYISEGSNYLGSKNMNGQYMYVVDMDGNIIIGTRGGQRMPHPTLVGGSNPQVQAAGMIEIRGGKIYSINNASGHFKPSIESLEVAENVFSNLPQNIFSKDFQGYLPYGE